MAPGCPGASSPSGPTPDRQLLAHLPSPPNYMRLWLSLAIPDA
nr:hypothetical protein [Escherichia coli]